VWIIWAILSLLIVIGDTFQSKKQAIGSPKTAESGPKFNIFRSKQSWYISLFMGLQSLIYYCLIALLPTILIEYGMNKSDAGWIISIIQLAMLPTMFIAPILAAKIADQKWMMLTTGTLMFLGLGLLAAFKIQ